MRTPEPDTPPHRTNIASRSALRLIDAVLSVLQGWRARLADTPSVEEEHGGRTTGPARAHDVAHPASEASTDTAKAKRPSLLLRLLIATVLLGAGIAAGGWLAYSQLKAQLAAHDSVVEGLQDDLKAAHSEEARNLKLLERFQRENAEHRMATRDAQHEAEASRREAAELQAEIDAMRREREQAERQRLAAEQAAERSARAAAKKSRQSSAASTSQAECTVGTKGDVSNCIKAVP